MQKVLLLNLIMIVLEIPLVSCFYGGGLMIAITITVFSIYILFTNTQNIFYNIIVFLASLILLAILLFVPIRVFLGSAKNRKDTIALIKWHVNTEDIETKVKLVKDLLIAYAIIIGGFIISYIVLYFNIFNLSS